MLKQYELKLNIKDDKLQGIYNWGSILQGCLLEGVPESYVQNLHEMHFNPYSQYIYKNESNEYIWVISTIGEDAFNNLLEENILKKDKLELKQKKMEVEILSKTIVKETSRKRTIQKMVFKQRRKFRQSFI
jgi:hypothetical protein